MTTRQRWIGSWAVSLAGAVAGAGCILAAAGAGAGSAIYVSDRGTESTVTASVERTFQATRQAFTELGIKETKTETKREDGAERRVLEGSTGERDVTVTMESQDQSTHVEVTARKSAVTWDKDFARKILEKIVGAAR